MAKSIQQSLFDAEEGIAAAVQHADNSKEGWSLQAAAFTVEYAKSRFPGSFLIEEVREYAAERGLPDPPDGRAWGAIPRRLQKSRLLIKTGHLNARSSNNSPKVGWRYRD